MPEIKHNFMKGKMNKDLDERLIPNGEYRHAMNIQVATSEGSDVGTAQNILGNSAIPLPMVQASIGLPGGLGGASFTLPDEAVCVGAISDEKNDVMYYLVWSPNTDYIFQWDGKFGTPAVIVFVDTGDKSILKFAQDMTITGINIIDGMLFWTDNKNEPRKINIQRCIDGTAGTSQTKLVNNSTGITAKMEEKHITVIRKGPQVAPDMRLHTSRDLNKIYTGIFTISSSEDLDGSDSSFAFDSLGDHDFSGLSVAEPNNRFYIKFYAALNVQGEEVALDPQNPLLGLTGWYPNGPPTDPADAKDILKGKKVVLQAYDEDGVVPGLPLTDFVIKGDIRAVSPTASTLGVTATTIDGFPPQAELSQTRKYVIDLFDEEEKLFEFKYPRFSYRYKFEDGEYSTFAPFTQVAFVPGSFDYHPRKGYNIGMTNKLNKVELLNIVTSKTPDDVVAIDILFKDDSSPSIYIVDTIRPDDYAGNSGNLWNNILAYSSDPTSTVHSFVIEKEVISSIIPSNQLLRPWDNVPKKALAQDVTGNRIVYGNYVQNYDLTVESGDKYVPQFTVGSATEQGSVGIPTWLGDQNQIDPSTNVSSGAFKSIKSLREYQLGVVFLDEYGRETPVLSNATGAMRFAKKDGDDINRFKVQFSSEDYPESLTHFKFYVKETSTEYYNMAMDRWYGAGDGNIWLAFPSSDRNKIDIDTFLILKKGSDQDTLVTEAARYKVLAIESEAPDFIKTTKRKAVALINKTGTSKDIFGSSSIDMPFEGETEFIMRYQAFHGTSGQDLAETEDELYIEFEKVGTDLVSARYKINSITQNWSDMTSIPDDTHKYSVKLDKPLGSDVNFISNNPGGNPSFIENGCIVNVYKYKVENLDAFDGRFFVKIYFDEVFKSNIETTEIGGGLRTTASEKVYCMDSDHVEKHTAELNRFATRSQGATRDELRFIPGGGPPPFIGASLTTWNPATGEKERHNHLDVMRSTTERFQMQYGYYAVDEFTAYALYFRRYREKPYTHYGANKADEDYKDYGLFQGNGEEGRYMASRLNRELNCRALVHLKTGGFEGGTNFDHDCEAPGFGAIPGTVLPSPHILYKGVYWKDTDEWEKEFGYNTCNQKKSLKGRAVGYLRSTFSGVTSSWERDRESLPFSSGIAGYYTWYKEGAGGYKSDERSVRDTEVWFIDRGKYIGKSASSTRKFPNTYYASGENHGIKTYSSEWKMDLSFGGIKTKENNGFNPIESFWNVGNWNSPPEGPNGNYNDGNMISFVNSLETGSRFRWKEDPVDSRIYTIAGNVTQASLFRHSDGPRFYNYQIEGLAQGDPYNSWDNENNSVVHPTSLTAVNNGNLEQFPSTEAPYHQDDLRSMAEGLSFNTNKRYRVNTITPAIQAWDPMSDGIIPGGLEVNLVCTTQTGSADPNSTIQTGTGVILVGANAEDLKVYVQAITVEDTNGVSNSLHEGMALTSYIDGNDATKKPSDLPASEAIYYVVRDIQKLFTDNSGGIECFALTLGGWKLPLRQDDHKLITGNSYPNSNPKPGSNITFQQVGMNGYSPNSEFNINTMGRKGGGFQQLSVTGGISGNGNTEYGAIGAVGYTLEFVEEIQPLEVLSENPAIFETEPKEATDLDIYYEACGSIPTKITKSTIESAFPIGTKFMNSGINTVVGYENEKIIVSGGIGINNGNNTGIKFFRPDDLIIIADIGSVVPNGSNFDVEISGGTTFLNNEFILPWHNCYTFRNGVESNRIRDNFNLPFISNGVKASTTLEQEYKEEHRKYGLIYSGIYNSTSGINNLNQFIAAEKITKDVNPIYGSIQKLYSRDSDLVTLCEDKILKITANKDALFNADGNPQLIATNRVLGQTVPFGGEYGISTNPESFAEESYRAYFTDKVRGAVMRLSKDGLTPISDAGMKDYFRDNLKNAKRLLGSYDDRNSEYNIALNFENRNVFDGEGYKNRENNKVLTFSEKVGGWVSFKSFTDMQYGISLANDYYTVRNGKLFLHHSNETRNTFYGVFHPSELEVVLNDNPGAVKVFNTLNYEGSQAHVDKFTSKEINGITYNDQEYYNLYDKKGWSVESIVTNKEEGKINEFLEKEGKWFNGINKIVDISAKAETSDFTFQGIGVTSSAVIDDDYVIDDKVVDDNVVDDNVVDDNVIDDNDDNDKPRVFGCTNPTANNYNALATDDDGSCAFDIAGCTNPKATNYNALATVDDGSCTFADDSDDRIFGCTNPIALNYNSLANVDDGSCILPPPKTTTTKISSTSSDY